MNLALPRFLKSAYRKEPIISILITMGVVNAVIGGLNDSWPLLTIGLGAAGVTFAFKWWRMQQQRPPLPEEPVAQHYLPSRSSSSTLPMLTIAKKKPPR